MKTLHLVAARLRRPVSDESGATLVFFGLMVVFVFACFSIAVDTGLWLNTRSEARRAADAAALAGAGEYMDVSRTPLQTVPFAEATALRFAELNYVGRSQIDAEANVEIVINDPTEGRVGVRITGGAPPLFARLIGITDLPVSAYAEARVMRAAGARCVKPFAMPDLWYNGLLPETNQVYNPADADKWVYNPGNGDRYQRWEGGLVSNTGETGYGASLRDGHTNWQGNSYMRDNGRRVLIKAAQPGQGGGNPQGGSSDIDVATNIHPGLFLPFQLPGPPPANANCGVGGSGSQSGASTYSQNICACNTNVVEVGNEYPLTTGNMVGPTRQGINDLMALETRTLAWRSTSTGSGGEVYDVSTGSRVDDSPRFIKVALYDPDAVLKSGKQSVKINNIAVLYLEGFDGGGTQANVVGRFMYYSDGVGTGNAVLSRNLQLVR